MTCIVCWFINGKLRERPEYAVEEKAEEMERQADELYAASPAERLTLFQ